MVSMGMHHPQPVPAERHWEIWEAALGFSRVQKDSIFRRGTWKQKRTVSSGARGTSYIVADSLSKSRAALRANR